MPTLPGDRLHAHPTSALGVYLAWSTGRTEAPRGVPPPERQPRDARPPVSTNFAGYSRPQASDLHWPEVELNEWLLLINPATGGYEVYEGKTPKIAASVSVIVFDLRNRAARATRKPEFGRPGRR